jgi:hypothetical protein
MALSWNLCLLKSSLIWKGHLLKSSLILVRSSQAQRIQPILRGSRVWQSCERCDATSPPRFIRVAEDRARLADSDRC